MLSSRLVTRCRRIQTDKNTAPAATCQGSRGGCGYVRRARRAGFLRSHAPSVTVCVFRRAPLLLKRKFPVRTRGTDARYGRKVRTQGTDARYGYCALHAAHPYSFDTAARGVSLPFSRSMISCPEERANITQRSRGSPVICSAARIYVRICSP